MEARILAVVENHPVLQAIARGQPVDELQLLELERTLQRELTGDLEATPENLRKAYGVQVNSFLEFVRGVLELDALPDYESIVGSQFQRFITTHHYNADQIRFLRAVQTVFLQKRRLALADLYEAPLTNFGENAVERWFSQQDIDDLLKMTEKISIE